MGMQYWLGFNYGASDVLKKRDIVNRVLEVAYGPDEENPRVGKTRLIADVLAS